MANADQIKAMLRAYKESDEPQLLLIALQIAAREAKAGHGKVAGEIRDLVDEVKGRAPLVPHRQPIPIAQPKGELADLVTVSYPETQLDDLILDPELRERLERVLREQRQSARIREHGLNPRRRLLFVGPPGTGKTMSASSLAGELSLPLFVLRLEGLFSRFMGEAAAKLKLIFENVRQVRGVYLFDEFDAVGQQRSISNDVGEIRRILNTFLQMIEQDSSQSLIFAATNHPELLDTALFRRFDDVLRFPLPDKKGIVDLLSRRVLHASTGVDIESVAAGAVGLSFADLQRACEDALKDSIVRGHATLDETQLTNAIRERWDDRNSMLAAPDGQFPLRL